MRRARDALALLVAVLPTTTTALAAPPTFTVNLSLPAAERWKGALSLIPHAWEDSWEQIFEAHNASLYSQLKPEQWAELATAMRTHYPGQAEELTGIAADFAASGHPVTFEYLVGWVYFHELAHSDLLRPDARDDVRRECTGVVAQDASGGIHHAANMDQSPPAVRNVTLRVRFVQGDELLFEGVDWYWFTTGVSRAVRKGLASVQENWRTAALRPAKQVLADIGAGAAPHILVFRSALSQQPPPSFDGLLAQLSSVRLAAPFYVVAAGTRPTEGAVLARNLTAVDHGVLRLAPGSGRWALVQTNYDHWVADPPEDPRRSAGEAVVAQLGQRQARAAPRAPPTTHRVPTAPPAAQAASSLGLFAVCSQYPVHNPHTAYTAVMRAATGARRDASLLAPLRHRAPTMLTPAPHAHRRRARRLRARRHVPRAAARARGRRLALLPCGTAAPCALTSWHRSSPRDS